MDKMHNPELLYNSFPLPWTLFSSNVNEVIRAVLIFFYEEISDAHKAQKAQTA